MDLVKITCFWTDWNGFGFKKKYSFRLTGIDLVFD
jgi:hypothetical protein